MQFFANQPSKSLDLLEFEHYLNFLNKIKLPSKVVAVIKAEPHTSDDMFGWNGLTSLTCLSETNEIYDIDVRYAWSSLLFKQHLVDHGWNETMLLENKVRGMPYRHKFIIYLCNISIRIGQPVRIEKVEENLFIGCYWQSIWHLYIQMPFEHPFEYQLHKDEHKDFQEESLLFDHAPVIINNKNAQIKTTPLLAAHPQRKSEGGLRKRGLYKHSVTHKPLISIITVVFNGEKYIEQTIQSVINQSYKNIEYIIIDGGSTDRTIDIIGKYEEYIDYWISEPDLNIYDAMNKGLVCALGEFVNFMNVGDIFFNHKIIELINFKIHHNSICGGNVFFSNKIRGIIYVNMQKKSIPHQALFMHRNDFEKYIFNPLYKYCADAELWTRFNPIRCSVNTTEKIVSISRFGGVSTSGKYLIPRMIEHWKFEQNKLKVLLRFIPKILLSLLLNDKVQEILYFRLKRT
jgi:hypothetical protein